MPRFAVTACLALALALVPSASSQTAASGIAKGVPSALHAFVLRADEPVQPNHTYAEMPAFVWHAVPHATRYELELADNPTFSDVSVLYTDSHIAAPVASIQTQLPWMSGNPYALWVHVRAFVGNAPTTWSKPFGFNMAWQNVPEQLPAAPGLIRWTPVEGATAYQVWFTNIGRSFMTFTNVADEREYWTLHPSLASTIRWRVRAVRTTANPSLPSGIAITPYGPWSDPFTTLNDTKIVAGPLSNGIATSDIQSSGPHALMPGFAWHGTNGKGPEAIGDQLWRVYVFSDRRCVNQVMVGSLTGEPAWAPRATQALAMPSSVKGVTDTETQGKILKYGSEGSTYMADLSQVTASENAGAAAGGSSSSGSGSGSSSGSSSGSGGSSGSAPSNSTSVATVKSGQVELPDSGWPTGRYWWTVVPVEIVDIPPDTSSSSTSTTTTSTTTTSTTTTSSSGSSSSGGTDDAVEYHDAELPQDACSAGRVWPFALRSAPVTTAVASKPFASGLALGQRIVAGAGREPKFVELPLVTWKPAIGAQSYEIELSRHLYPWSPVKKQTSLVTSTVLPLGKSDHGTWYYRVRGVNPNLPANAQKMTWSQPVALKITGNLIAVLG